MIRKICESNYSCLKIDHPILAFSMEILLFTRAYSNYKDYWTPSIVLLKIKKAWARIVIFACPPTQARLAQSVEHQTFNLRVAGSSPSSGDENFETEIIIAKRDRKAFDVR